MKKETIVAVLMGVIFGLAVAFFMIAKTKTDDMQNKKTIALTGKITPTISATSRAVEILEITSPKDGVVVTTNNIKLTGKAKSDSLLVVQTPLKDTVLYNKQANFSVDLSLSEGENVILIDVYPKDRSLPTQEKELRVYYLKEL